MVANGESADEAVRNLVKTWKLVKEKDKNYKYANDLKKVFKHAAGH